MKRLPIETAPTDGTKFIGLKDDVARTTWRQAFYDKWPHQEGGPTFRYAWNYEALDGHFQWKPTHWTPLPPC
jgi:hypothetical protein